MKNLIIGLSVIFAVSFTFVGCGDEDLCTTCEWSGNITEVCPDNLAELSAEWGGTTLDEVIATIETQGGTCD